jgi:RNA polymerase-binding transcription factor DksA
MRKEALQQFRDQLVELGTRVGADLAAVSEQVRGSSGQSQGGLSNAPFHLGDMGTEEYIHDLNTTVLENEQHLANEIVAAMRRIEAGSYGTCESCGTSIPTARLKAAPYARFCVKCAETHQNGSKVNLNVGRPRRPEDTMAPEGDMDEDRRPIETGLSAMTSARERIDEGDVHASGTPGGGTAVGGLAGMNSGRGDPDVSDLNEAFGSGNYDSAQDRREENDQGPRAGHSGGAVGGTPARKRAK